MQSIKGKLARTIARADVAAWAARYDDVVLDLGTGDGRFVGDLARRCPRRAAIGVDTCRENLRHASRTAPENALFVVADALALPAELDRLATELTINFPWGSLLVGLLDGHGGLLDGLRLAGRPGARIEIRLNAGAMAEAGWSLVDGAERVTSVLRRAGCAVGAVEELGPDHLRRCPTTWAKRLAFGRDPRAIRLVARLA